MSQCDLLVLNTLLPECFSDENPIGVLSANSESVGSLLTEIGQKIITECPRFGISCIPDRFTAINIFSSLRNFERAYDLKTLFLRYFENTDSTFDFCEFTSESVKGDCSICEIKDVNIITSPNCTHSACEKCWKKQILTDIEEKRSQLPRCVGFTSGCTRYINENFVRQLDVDFLTTVQNIQINNFLRSSSLLPCCDKIYFNPVSYESREKLLNLNCLECHRRKCFGCRRYSHVPIPCDLLYFFRTEFSQEFAWDSFSKRERYSVTSSVDEDHFITSQEEEEEEEEEETKPITVFNFFNINNKRQKNKKSNDSSLNFTELDLGNSSLLKSSKHDCETFLNFSFFAGLAQEDYEKFSNEKYQYKKRFLRLRFFILKFISYITILKHYIILPSLPQFFPPTLKKFFGNDFEICKKRLIGEDSIGNFHLLELKKSVLETYNNEDNNNNNNSFFNNYSFLLQKLEALYGDIYDILERQSYLPNWREFGGLDLPNPHPILLGDRNVEKSSSSTSTTPTTSFYSFIAMFKILKKGEYNPKTYLQKISVFKLTEAQRIRDLERSRNYNTRITHTNTSNLLYPSYYQEEDIVLEKSKKDYEDRQLEEALRRSLLSEHNLLPNIIEEEQQEEEKVQKTQNNVNLSLKDFIQQTNHQLLEEQQQQQKQDEDNDNNNEEDLLLDLIDEGGSLLENKKKENNSTRTTEDIQKQIQKDEDHLQFILDLVHHTTTVEKKYSPRTEEIIQESMDLKLKKDLEKAMELSMMEIDQEKVEKEEEEEEEEEKLDEEEKKKEEDGKNFEDIDFSFSFSNEESNSSNSIIDEDGKLLVGADYGFDGFLTPVDEESGFIFDFGSDVNIVCVDEEKKEERKEGEK